MRYFANGWIAAALLSAAGCSEAVDDVDAPRAQDEVVVESGRDVPVQPVSNHAGEPQNSRGAEASGLRGSDPSAAALRVFETRLQSRILASSADGDALSLNDLGKFLEELCKQTFPALHDAGGAGAADVTPADGAPAPLTPEQVHKILEDLFAFFTKAFPPADNNLNANADAALTPEQIEQILKGLFDEVAKAFPPPDSSAPELKPEDVLKFLDDLFNLFFPKPSDGTAGAPTPPDATRDDADSQGSEPGDPSISTERTPDDDEEESGAPSTASTTPDVTPPESPESAPDAVRAD